jgi:benzoyl-CoA reductase/2-hydroxyglutaryl-CoA dehydratase subunit BcrC/BadD/HgdB
MDEDVKQMKRKAMEVTWIEDRQERWCAQSPFLLWTNGRMMYLIEWFSRMVLVGNEYVTLGRSLEKRWKKVFDFSMAMARTYWDCSCRQAFVATLIFLAMRLEKYWKGVY